MEEEAKRTFADEVDSRLEDLFGAEKGAAETGPPTDEVEIVMETTPADEPLVEAVVEEQGVSDEAVSSTAPPQEQQATASEPSPLRELRSTVLSIDWEITDEVMGAFLGQVEALKGLYGKDRWASLLLQGLSSLGRYIRKRKGQAHPNSINVLKSLYESLERVTAPGETDEEEKKRIVARELGRFKGLKKEVAAGRPSGATLLPRKAVDEIKEVIRSEFAALRTELRSILERKSD